LGAPGTRNQPCVHLPNRIAAGSSLRSLPRGTLTPLGMTVIYGRKRGQRITPPSTIYNGSSNSHSHGRVAVRKPLMATKHMLSAFTRGRHFSIFSLYFLKYFGARIWCLGQSRSGDRPALSRLNHPLFALFHASPPGMTIFGVCGVFGAVTRPRPKNAAHSRYRHPGGRNGRCISNGRLSRDRAGTARATRNPEGIVHHSGKYRKISIFI
jgi:hypothetical protein